MDVARNHILVVDDNVDAAESTVELLSLWGYDAVACYGGPAALEAACLHRPDAVLLDLIMPNMNGFQFAERFRELHGCGAVPLIVVSGDSSRISRSNALGIGIRHYLLKPVEPECLRTLLVREIEDAANRRLERLPKRARQMAPLSRVQQWPVAMVRERAEM